MNVPISLEVNGKATEVEVEPRLLLVHLLREKLGLTGTKVGCDTSSCGACTVMVDGESVKSCTMLAVQADGRSVTSIEGLAGETELHPVQKAFWEHHGLQCGYCTPGMVMAITSLIDESDSLDETSVREHLEGNFCRCTGYNHIVDSAMAAFQVIQREKVS